MLLVVEVLAVVSAVFFFVGIEATAVVVAAVAAVAARGVSRAKVDSGSVLNSFVDSSNGEVAFELEAVLVREESNTTLYGSTGKPAVVVDDVDHSDAPKAEVD
jgi:hypothetical protein